MIQRVQSVYLFLCFLASGVLPLLLFLWTREAGEIVVFATDVVIISFLFAASAVLALTSLLLFKNRKNQFVLNRINLVVQLVLIGFLLYYALNLYDDPSFGSMGPGAVLPLISVVLLVLANRGIKKDEDLIRSADRLR